METDQTSIDRAKNARHLIIYLVQPGTAKQLANATGIAERSASDAFSNLVRRGLVRCLNPEAGRSRVHWLTAKGQQLQRQLRLELNLPEPSHRFPSVDWQIYGDVCFSHRSAVIKALEEPLCPAAIKRRARFREPGIRMSANNVRDVIRFLRHRGVVTPVTYRKEAHPRYQLNETGTKLQALLLNAESLGEPWSREDTR